VEAGSTQRVPFNQALSQTISSRLFASGSGSNGGQLIKFIHPI
jgi:hypothetical protein